MHPIFIIFQGKRCAFYRIEISVIKTVDWESHSVKDNPDLN